MLNQVIYSHSNIKHVMNVKPTKTFSSKEFIEAADKALYKEK